MDLLANIHVEVPGGFFLSRICCADKDAYIEHMADPEIARHTLSIPFPYTKAHAARWVEHCEKQARDPEVRFAIRDPFGRLVGAIGIVGDLPSGARCAEFGYWLAKAYRGRGTMSHAVGVFADYAFAQLGLHRLYAMPFDFNPTSHRVLEKAGFQREEVLRSQHCKDGIYLDAVLYALQSPRTADPCTHALGCVSF